MVRTGARATVLGDLVAQTGLRPAGIKPKVPRGASLPPAAATEILDLYRRLGGALATPSFRPGPWDLAFDGDIVVELDEELHFNRYRLLTLDSSWYRRIGWVAAYRRFCAENEGECLTAGDWGKRWTNPSCELMFGAPGRPGQLDGAGAPRWKQRALYDAIKDLAPLAAPLRVVRVSVYDRVDERTLAECLRRPASTDIPALGALLDERIAGHDP